MLVSVFSVPDVVVGYLTNHKTAIQAAINCYNLGCDVKKNKDLNKVIDADKEGKPEDWVKKTIASGK